MEIAIKSENAVFIGTTCRHVAKRLYHQQRKELALEINKFALQFLQKTTSLYSLIIRDLYYFCYGVWLNRSEVQKLSPERLDITPNFEISQKLTEIFCLDKSIK